MQENRKEVKDRINMLFFGTTIFGVMTIYFTHLYVPNSVNLDIFTHCDWAHNLLEYYKELLSRRATEVPSGLAYPGWHLTFLFLYFFFNNDAISSGMTNAVYVTITAFFLLLFFDKYIEDTRRKGMKYFYTSILLFAGPLYCPWINENYYLGQLTGSLWHNPTTIAVKPFAIACLYYLLEICNSKEKTNNYKNYICLSLILMTSLLFKPSFAQVFIPALALFCIILLLLDLKKYKSLIIKLFFCCVPACFVMAIQYYIVYVCRDAIVVATQIGGADRNMGIGFSPFLIWREWTSHIAGSIAISLLFPIFVYIFRGDKSNQNKKEFILGICILMGGLLPFAFLFNYIGTYNGDFYWGASLTVFLLFTLCCIFIERYRANNHIKTYRICKDILLAHFICGFIYWIQIYRQLSYSVDFLCI